MDTIELTFCLMVFIFYNCVMRLTKSNKLTAWSSIQMLADKTAELNISGYIGVPEWWQFDPDMEKDLISTKEKMQAELKEISNLKVDIIKVNIDSLGGCPNHAQAMRTALIKTRAEIHVDYIGWSASAATIINPNKNGENTTMSSSNLLLIHQSRGCECGVASNLRAFAETLEKINDVMADVYVDQTGKSKEDVSAQMNINNGEGEWMTPEEALNFGLVGSINEPLKVAANYDTSRLSKFGYKIPQNKLNNLNMRFKKEAINALAMQDESILLHEGELKVGTEVQKAGETVELKGDYVAADGRTLVIDGNKVTEIKAKVEVDPKTANSEEVVDQVAQILVDFEEKIDAKLEALKKGGSSMKVPKVDKPAETKTGTQASAGVGVEAAMKIIAEEKRKLQDN